MKILIAASMISIASLASAGTEGVTETQHSTEFSILFDGGKKKARRNKRANRKRKKRCNRAARRNFAG